MPVGACLPQAGSFLMIGKTLGHYRVLEKIGAGGMGEVYRAHDERLDRDVALKVLPAGALADAAARKRFRKEALALSKLNHPNIETVYDFDTQEGVDFLVMEHIGGESLAEKVAQGALGEKEVGRLGMQLAEGMAAAHAAGVVHRDLKPGNLRVTPDGRLKILDFGLAKLLRPVAEPGAAPTESLTETRGITGTLPYMAPEQLRGEEVDARADLWAAGAVLYEMATSQRPFKGKTGYELSSAILNQAPQPPSELNRHVSPELERIILKCLEKDPEHRYQSARELLADFRRLTAPAVEVPRRQVPAGSARLLLRLGGVGLAVVVLLAVLFGLNVGRVGEWLGMGGATRIDSIAVLPLANLSGDPEQEYFVDGMTEALITELSKIGALKVISRTSAMRYKGTDKPLPQIARELGVDAVVEGSVLRVGEQVRITAQLVEAATDRHLWAESYQRGLTDILALQSEVARAIAREIKVTVTPAEEARLARARPVNPEVYELYLRGRYHCAQWTPKEMNKAVEYLQQAIERDPGYAPAHAELATCYTVLAFFDYLLPREAYPKTRAAANKALEIDDRLAEAHVALGGMSWYFEWNLQEAEREYKQAIELNPNHSMAHVWSAYTLGEAGRWEEAVAAARRAQELDPLSLWANNAAGEVFYLKREYDQAIKEFGKNLDLDPNDAGAYYFLAWPYEQKGIYAEAIALLEKAVTLSESVPIYVAGLGHAYALAGKRSEALKILDQLQGQTTLMPPSPFDMALVYIGLGDKEKAFEWLEKAYEERSMRLVFLKEGPRFDSLRSDPRFQDLLRRMNFPED
ncbi:MAG: protein kinase [Terriglobia bacterium]